MGGRDEGAALVEAFDQEVIGSIVRSLRIVGSMRIHSMQLVTFRALFLPL